MNCVFYYSEKFNLEIFLAAVNISRFMFEIPAEMHVDINVKQPYYCSS